MSFSGLRRFCHRIVELQPGIVFITEQLCLAIAKREDFRDDLTVVGIATIPKPRLTGWL